MFYDETLFSLVKQTSTRRFCLLDKHLVFRQIVISVQRAPNRNFNYDPIHIKVTSQNKVSLPEDLNYQDPVEGLVNIYRFMHGDNSILPQDQITFFGYNKPSLLQLLNFADKAFIPQQFSLIAHGANSVVLRINRPEEELSKNSLKDLVLKYSNPKSIQRETQVYQLFQPTPMDIFNIQIEYVQKFIKDIDPTRVIFLKNRECTLNHFLEHTFKGLNIDECEKTGFLLKLFLDICKQVQFLHHNNILHRDIKPENILIDDYQPYLTDFDLSTNIEDSKTKNTGTPIYRDPQNTREAATVESDVYSLGCLLFYIFNQKNPFISEEEYSLLEKSCSSTEIHQKLFYRQQELKITQTPQRHEGILNDVDELINLCIQYQRDHRIKLNDLMIRIAILYDICSPQLKHYSLIDYNLLDQKLLFGNK